MKKIFVMIASYRDPELVPTIRDCISKCSDMSRLTFGVVRQYDPEDEFNADYEEVRHLSGVRTLDFHYSESRGLGWARAHAQSLYEGEELTMQLDSHHRFVEGWDLLLEDAMAKTDSPMPFLTTYCPTYEPGQALNGSGMNNAIALAPLGFRQSHGTIPFAARYVGKREKPIPARFASGHFFFTHGSHCLDYRYDPQLYFFGDELCLSLRSYTMGYDLFHPHVNVLWHNYATYKRRRNHDDVKNWTEIDAESIRRIDQLTGYKDHGIDLGPYGLGTARTVRDYELYAGLDFRKRRIHPDAIALKPPPTISDPTLDWTKNLRSYQITLKTYASLITNFDYSHVYVGFETSPGKAVHVEHVSREELERRKHGAWWFTFYSEKLPNRLALYGYRDGRWSSRLEIPFVESVE